MNDPDTVNESRYLAALADISMIIGKGGDNHRTLDQILPAAIKHTGAEFGYLVLVKEAELPYQVISALDNRGKSLEGDMDQATRSLIETSASEATSIIVAGATSDPRFLSIADEEPTAASYLLVPMLVDNETRGVIVLAHASAGQFNEVDRRFISVIATLAAQLVENENQVQTIDKIQQDRRSFISLTTHERRVPLTSIGGYADIIINGMTGPITDKQEKFLRTIRRNVDRMSILIDTLGEMNRIDDGRRKFDVKAIDVGEIAEAAILELEEDLAGRDQELVVDLDLTLPPVLVDRGAVITALNALIINASHYSADHTLLSLRISSSGELIQMEVIDEGVGISLEDQAEIFSPFFRSDDPVVREYTGWGLSLAHAKKLIEALGGTISFTSTYGKGSNFIITIPVAIK